MPVPWSRRARHKWGRDIRPPSEKACAGHRQTMQGVVLEAWQGRWLPACRTRPPRERRPALPHHGPRHTLAECPVAPASATRARTPERQTVVLVPLHAAPAQARRDPEDMGIGRDRVAGYRASLACRGLPRAAAPAPPSRAPTDSAQPTSGPSRPVAPLRRGRPCRREVARTRCRMRNLVRDSTPYRRRTRQPTRRRADSDASTTGPANLRRSRLAIARRRCWCCWRWWRWWLQ